MTTKLIQELVGLCVDKGVYVTYNPENSWLLIDNNEAIFLNADITTQDAPAQLQAAIDKIKEL